MAKDYTLELAQQKERQTAEHYTHSILSSHYKNYTPDDKTTLHKWSVDTNSVKHETMDAAIHRHTLPMDTTLWSKTRMDPRGSETVLHPHPMATTIHKNTATDYLKDHHVSSTGEHHILKINAPAGTHAAFIHDQDSINPKYKEVVLPRNSRFKYSHTDTNTNGSRVEHTHHMELIK